MKNDYDALAAQMRAALSEFSGSYHDPQDGSDSVTITKDGLLRGINKLQRTIDWCQGLADSHHANRFYIRGWTPLGILNTILAFAFNRVLVLHKEGGKVVGWHIGRGTDFPPVK